MLLDEAFVSLDERTAARMRRLMLEMLGRRRAAAILVTHDVGEAAEMADRVLILRGATGRLTAEIRFDTQREGRDADWLAEREEEMRGRMA